MLSAWMLLFVAQSFDTSAWEHRGRVGTSGAEYAEFAIGRDAMTRLQYGFGDLRLMRDGRELPYTIERRGARSQPYEIESKLIDEAFTASGDLVIVLDFGARTKPHDRIEFSVMPEDFRYPVKIETSDDRRTWFIARRDAAIAGFAQDGSRISLKTVSYPRSSKRFLKATIGGVKTPKTVAAIRSLRYEEKPAELEQVAVIEPTRSTDAGSRTTVIEFDFGAERILHDRVRLETSAKEFYRAATVEVSSDRKTWRYVATAALSRVEGHDDLSIEYSETGERYLRVKVHNGDDPPVPFSKGTFESVRRVAIFPGGAGETWALAGNPSARTPQYDFAQLRSRRAERSAERVTATNWEANPAYRPPPKPATERAPWLLYTVLGIAVVAMGAAAVRLMKKANA